MGRLLHAAALTAATLACTCTARAVVVHPDSPTAPNPGDAVVGQWAGASAVAIAPNWFLSSRHQGGSASTLLSTATVAFGGQPFKVVERVDIYDPVRTGYTTQLPADLVLWRVESHDGGPTALPDWTPISTATSLAPATSVSIGGFGRTRDGAAQVFPGVGAGYAVTAGGSGTVQWGQNQIDGAGTAQDPPPDVGTPQRRSVVVTADFDGPSPLLAEATVAAGDSGGGWFRQRLDGTWEVVAVTRAVEHPDQAIFSPPEAMDAVWVSAYADQINAALVPEPGTVLLVGVVLAGWSLRRRRDGVQR